METLNALNSRRATGVITYDRRGEPVVNIKPNPTFVDYKTIENFLNRIKSDSGVKAVGDSALMELLSNFQDTKAPRIFIPWAASVMGRNFNDTDRDTIDGIFKNVIGPISALGQPEVLIMFADIYARNNNADIKTANDYWREVSDYFWTKDSSTQFTATSLLEGDEMDILRSQTSYALEALNKGTQGKILKAARKYSGSISPLGAYESAANYAMIRAAEARYVYEILGALWLSPNHPERDAMCGNTPRIYLPENIRAPWLKG